MDLHNQEPNQFGDQDSAELQDSSASAPAVGRGAAQVLVADQSGVVVLPAGTELGDIRIEGRDLVVIGADGVRYVIPDGAIIVPQLVIDDVVIPPLNLAALLIGNEPQPAAGNPQSSGGNFASAVGPLQAAYGLGDLLPYTELAFPQPEEREIIPNFVDREPTVGIITPDNPTGASSAGASVSEAGLPGTRLNGSVESPGSNASTNSETTAGSIVFLAEDGLASITLNGTAITAVGQQFTTPNGVLTITSIAPGNYGYSYTLTDNTNANTNPADIFVVVVTDTDGDTATANLTISILDDAPDARADTDAVAAGTYGPETGNVISGSGTTSGAAGADVQGADGARVTSISGAGGSDSTFDAAGNLVIAGQYGNLTIKADGSYSYVRTPNTAGGVTDVFTYTLTDGDGDSDTATLTISIGDSPASVVSLPTSGAGTIVDEAGLPARTDGAPGTAEATPVETTNGAITVVAPDGIASVKIGETIVTGAGQIITVPQGTLTITSYDPATGAITYSFTLTDNTTGDTTSVSFPVTVTDVDGDSDTKTLTITILDDAPIANDDTATQSAENVPVTVDVLGNDIEGADSVQPGTVALVAGSLSGTGTLVNNGDGTFTYMPGNGETGSVTFDYTITDGDGDTDQATVRITLAADSTPTIAVAGDDTVDEAALPARPGEPEGSNSASTDETAAGTIALTTGGDTVGSLVVNGVDVTAGGTVTTAKGTLTISVSAGAYTYSYTLADNTLTDPDSDTFTLVVTDSDGDTASTSLVIAIADDQSTAADDAAALAAGTYGPIGGNVVTNDTQGADAAEVVSYSGVDSGTVGSTVNGQYGTLTIDADGEFSYTRNAGTPGNVTDTFTYTIEDGDGDQSTAQLVITIGNAGTTLDLPIAGTPGVTQVLEAGLDPDGSDAAGNGEFATGSFTFTAPDGPAIVTIDGAVAAVGQTYAGAFGTLTITGISAGSVDYTYELTTNTVGDSTFDDFAIVVSDQDGDNTAGTLQINIVDDLPTALNDGPFGVVEDGVSNVAGNVLTNDASGADTPKSFTAWSAGNAAEIADLNVYGTLTLNPDGSYSYVLDNSRAATQALTAADLKTYTLDYTMQDADGDVSPATLTITITGANDGATVVTAAANGPDNTVFESGLNPNGSQAAGNGETSTGTFTVSATDGIATVTIGGTVFTLAQVQAFGTTNGVVDTGEGTLTLTGYTGSATSGTVSYSYTLKATIDNDSKVGATGTEFDDAIALSVAGLGGTAAGDTLVVRIVDDLPTA
ncbi:beta strand repeat-containing protein, partial [Tsuneonella troitsensis]